MSTTRNALGGKGRKHTIGLLALAAGMFGFAFALVPLYDAFCKWTGLNGTTSGRASYISSTGTPTDREVTIQFLAQAGNGMPWEFRPTQSELRVRLGTLATTTFYVRNRSATAVTGQAVPSVAPGLAAPYLNKLECFCFTPQRLDAGAEMNMPVRFYVSTDLPRQVHTLTLSYTLFPVGAKS
ncbi:MAG TPA: cytochrome c oxidase assembly protein [Steroidobacter sp.]|uniref:cytochrome c oxidase assembly protein n=1 Tax=Steroidobacter sp. TaxID=1978227 RepID=UPI002EDB11C5